MPRRISLLPRPTGLKKWPWRVNLPARYTNTGKRQRHFFKMKREAETFAQVQRIRIENYGRNSSLLSPGQQEEAAIAFQKLADHNVSLNTVVAEWIARHDARTRSVTFDSLCEQFINKKEKKSKPYLRALRYTAVRFSALDDRKVCDIEPAEIDRQTQGMTPAARNAYLRNAKAIFNFGVKRGWLEQNPIAKIDLDEVKNGEVVTLTPNQAESLMLATEDDIELLPYHALGLFAGIRPFELQRLNWQHVDLTERHIEIMSAVSKTRRRRIIEIEPNLATWLSYYIAKGGETVGSVTPSSNLRRRLRAIRKDAGIMDWMQDVMRHSYASYALAKHGDIGRLTLAMGHTSAAVLWNHYHRAAKRKDAEAYWNIMPRESGDAKIVPIATRGARA
jgi:integrase